MNLQILVPAISKLVGKDLTADVNLFYRSRAAVGASLNPAGQQFFMENWRHLPTFMETAAGRKAIADFMNAWVCSMVPQSIAAEPIPDPAPLPALEQASVPQQVVPVVQPVQPYIPQDNPDHATGSGGNAFL